MSDKKRLILQSVLFLVTVFTTTLAGAELIANKSILFGEVKLGYSDFLNGFYYSIPFLLILSFHEFGHYFTARYHGIRTTLPYYIPLWVPISISFGTMGALIRIQDAIRSRKHYFDVGISGPLAGFVVAIGVIWYGFTHLPEPEYIFQVHPEYAEFGMDYENHVYTYEFSRKQDSLYYLTLRARDSVSFIQSNQADKIWTYKEFKAPDSYPTFQLGKTLAFTIAEKFWVSDKSRIPNTYELIHYPFLFVGFLSLFFTALNLLPIGQLDGGHIIFGLFGIRNHRTISRILFVALVFYSGLGVISLSDLQGLDAGSLMEFALILGLYLYFLYLCAFSMMEKRTDRWLFAALILSSQFVIHAFTGWVGYSGWLVFSLILGRFIGIYHPRVVENRPLSSGRKVLGWIALIIFILSFSPKPFIWD